MRTARPEQRTKASPARAIRPITGHTGGGVRRQRRTTETNIRRDLEMAARATSPDGSPAFSSRFLQVDTDALRPAQTHFHFHKIFIWVRDPISHAERDVLRANALNIEILKHGDWYYADGKPVYQLNNPKFAQRIELKVPNDVALDCLAARKDTSVTLAEFAVDCLFPNDVDRLNTQKAFDIGFVQRWQRDNDRRSWIENDGTSTGRRRGLYHTWYSDRPSPAAGDHDLETGEVLGCFHMEGRVNTGTKMKQLGIANARDAANFDHAAFWRERFSLYVLDFEKLGRFHLNKKDGTKRRTPHPEGYNGRNYDWHTGRVLWRANSYDDSGVLSVQTFLKNYGRGPFLKAVSVQHLLGSGNGSMSIAK